VFHPFAEIRIMAAVEEDYRDDSSDDHDEYEYVRVPPAPSLERHPASNPKEIHRRMAIQCQYCWKPGGPRVKLLKCKGCGMSVYCSKECQRAAWREHKPKCMESRETRAGMDADLLLQRRLLHKFIEKHRPTILNTSYRALEIEKYPERALENVLSVDVQWRPGQARTETTFYVVDAEVTPIDSFVRAGDRIRECLLAGPGGLPVTEDQKKGIFHGYMVVFTTDNDEVAEFMPVAFSTTGEKDVYSRGEIPGVGWREQLMMTLNEGIVY